jgi:hypothetical protein
MISKETVTTPKGILSWPAIMEPAFKYQSTTEKEYRCDILFPLDADFTEMEAAIDKVATRAFGKDWKKEPQFKEFKGGMKLNPKYVGLPFKDQAEKVRKDRETGEEKVDKDGNVQLQQGCVAGARWIHAKNDVKFKPTVKKLVANGVAVDVTDPIDIYSGAIVAASVSVFDWEFGGKRGISLRLLSICKAGNGKPFGQSMSAEANFSSVELDEDEEAEEYDDPMK